MKNRTKIITLSMMLIVVFTACDFLTGKKVISTNPETGEVTVTYEKAPITNWAKAIGIAVPALGIIATAAAGIASSAARTKNAIFDSNEEFLETTDWSKVNTKETAKELMSLAQKSKDDSKLLAKAFKKWNAKRKIKNAKKSGSS